jgi:hypothetical protein
MNRDLLEEALTLFMTWQNMGAWNAVHIRSCETCMRAERTGVGYCSRSDAMWTSMMEVEAGVQAMIPRLRDEGVDVEKHLKGFKFACKR